MEKDPKGTDPRAAGDPRPVYESPQVLRLGELHRGAGDCSPTGSGDWIICQTLGNSAVTYCDGTGNGTSYCSTGNSAVSPG